MQFLDKRVRFLYPSFLVYMGEILLQFWNLKKLFQFSPKLWLYAITMPHFQFCTNNQQQLVIFIHVMVSAGVCFDGKGRLHLIPTRTKWMLNFMLKHCYRNLFKIANLFCHLASSFNRTARLHTHTAKLAQDWTATNCSEFIGKDEWPPNSPDLNPVDYHVWGSMLERYKSFQPSQRTSMSSRKFCSWYGTSCPKTRSRKQWASRRLQAYVKAGDGHFKQMLKWTILSDFSYL